MGEERLGEETRRFRAPVILGNAQQSVALRIRTGLQSQDDRMGGHKHAIGGRQANWSLVGPAVSADPGGTQALTQFAPCTDED